MIIDIHSKEIESKSSVKIIKELSDKTNEAVLHITDKDTAAWQEIIKSDEPIRFVGPVYWWGMGYEFDKWIQNILSYGFAYEYKEGVPTGLLQSRKFEIHLIHGTPAEFATEMRSNISERLTKGVFGFCDATVEVKFYDMNYFM